MNTHTLYQTEGGKHFVRSSPMTDAEIIAKAELVNGSSLWVTDMLLLDTSDMIENSLEGWLDLLGELLVDSPALMEPGATPLAVTADGAIIFAVSGCVDEVLGDDEYDLALAAATERAAL